MHTAAHINTTVTSDTRILKIFIKILRDLGMSEKTKFKSPRVHSGPLCKGVRTSDPQRM